jgi:hypothetical protein
MREHALLMQNSMPQKNNELRQPNQTLILRYEGENDQEFFVTDLNGARLNIPKNRNIPKPFREQPPQPFTSVYRILALAFLGLAPAGLGALVLAPLAALWALVMLGTHSFVPGGQIRVLIVCGIAFGMLGLAIPMSVLFIARLH